MIDFEEVFDSVAKVSLYLTIGIVGAIALVGALVYFYKRNKFADFKKYALGIAIGYAVSLLVVMTYLKFEGIKADDDVDMSTYGYLLYPLVAEASIAIVGAVATFAASMFSKKARNISAIVSGVLLLGGFVAIMVCMSKYYQMVADWYPNANLTGMIVSGVVFVALLIGAYFLGDKRSVSDTRSIVYGAISIALSFALSYIRFFKMPQGGSITFASLLPLIIYCCMFGTRRGVIVCAIYGMLQAMQDPWIIHPMQFLLDYPLAFGLIGISGLFMEKGVFKNKKVLAFLLGGIVGVVFRYACHVCSGVFAFADYADLDTYASATAYSFAYNSFALIDMIVALSAGSLLFASKSFRAQMVKSSDLSVAPKEEIVINDDDDDEFEKLLAQNENAREEVFLQADVAQQTSQETPIINQDTKDEQIDLSDAE